jgi:type I restriction enzyme S subunit
MSKITITQLGEILQFQRGYDLPETKRIDGEYPVISSAGFSGTHAAYKVDGENVVTGRYGTIGEIYYYNGKCWPLNTSLYVKDFKGNLPKYIFYLLQYALKVDGKDKSTVPGVDRNVLHMLKIPFAADTHYQKKVIEPLVAVDSKIALNKRISTDLEAMAKTLYNYWFVQFDFPDENGKPYRTSGGAMEWNEQLKREIPKGWSANVIKPFISIIRGVTYGRDDVKNVPCKNYTPLLRANNISNGTINYDSMVYVWTDLISNEQMLTANSIFMCMSSGSKEHIGKTSIVMNDINSAFGAFCSKINIRDDAFAWLSMYFRSQYFNSYIRNMCLGTSINNLNNDILYNIVLPIPPKDIQQSYSKAIYPMLRKQGQLQCENLELTHLRDWLLPMLMNGQATVE